MTKKNALESYNRSRYNALKHGRYSVVLKDYPCTKTKCPLYDFCDYGRKKNVKYCQLKKEAAISMLKSGLNVERINMDNLIESKMNYDITSLREHVMGLPGEQSRKWLEIMDKQINTGMKIEKTRKSSGDTAKSLKTILADAAEILKERENEKEKRKAIDTRGHIEKY